MSLEQPTLSNEDEAVKKRRDFLKVSGAAALLLATEGMAIAQTDRSKDRFEKSEAMSGYVNHPEKGKISVEVRVDTSKGINPEAKVFINGQERRVISYLKKGPTQEGVFFEPERPGSHEFIATNNGRSVYRIETKNGVVPLIVSKN